MRRKCAECGEGKSPQDFSQEQWDATPSVCMECEELLNSSGSEEDVIELSENINSSRGNGEDSVSLHVQSNISSSSASSFSSADDKLRQQISALRNDFASLVNLTQAKLDSASHPSESIEAQLRKEILTLKEQLEDRELDYLILTAEKNTLLQTARCQPITPRSQARLRSMGKSRLQAANEAWESFIKDLPQEEVEESQAEVPPGRVQFNEKKNQEYDHGDVMNEAGTNDDSSNGNNSNSNNTTNNNNRAVSEDEAVAQQMRLRASLRDTFAKKNTVDEHLLYKMHTVNFSPLLNSVATKTKAEESKQQSNFELRPLTELADDCFERPIAAGLVAEFLSPKECSILIDAAKHLELKPVSTTFHPSYRNDKRVILWDPNLAAMLWGRVKSLLPRRLSDRWSADWTVLGFGSRISISEYGENTRYAPHQDSEYVENSATESLFSVIVCLQPSGEGEGMKGGGGEINFVDPTQVHEVKLSVSMRAGELLLFPHYLWHETSRVTHGTRYEMRLEVLCREVSSEKDDGNNSDEAEEEDEDGGEEGDEGEEGNSEGEASETESIDDSELPPLDDTQCRTHHDEEGGEEGGKQEGEKDVEHEDGISEEDEGDHTP